MTNTASFSVGLPVGLATFELRITTLHKVKAMIPKQRKPSHPGEILVKEFLEPLGMTQVELAKAIGVPVQRVNTIINGKRGITATTAWLLARKFKTTPEFWMNLQTGWDLSEAAKTLKVV
jgi:antitoxin HigA-1